MSNSRRTFLKGSTLALLASAAGCNRKPEPAAQLPPGAPPAFGTSPQVGPEVSSSTFAAAEKLVQVEFTAPELEQAAASWRANMAALYERRTGPRKLALVPADAPYSIWDPVLRGEYSGPAKNQFILKHLDPGPLPTRDDDIAFAPVTQLARWIEQRKLTSTRLTQIYLDRIQKFDAKLRCIITLMRDSALAQAKKADEEIAAGKYRGPLHGIPWGAKDLLDTAGTPTTYGAEPFKNRVPDADAAVVKRLHDAGAVLLAKLSMGGLSGRLSR